MRNKKRFISILLLVVMLMQICTVNSLATNTINSEQDFFTWLESQSKCIKVDGLDGRVLKANYLTFKKYDEIVYGSHTDVKNNRQDKFGEWEYLGYAEDGRTVYGNSKFRHDAISRTFPYTTRFIQVQNGFKSWDNTSGIDSSVKQWIENTVLRYEDSPYNGVIPNFRIKNINSDYKKYVKLIAIPTWKSKGNYYVQNRSGGHIYYSNFTQAPLNEGNNNVKCTLSTFDEKGNPTTSFTLPKDKDELNIKINVNSSLNLGAGSNAKQVKENTATLESVGNLSFGRSYSNTVEKSKDSKYTGTIILKRNEIKTGTMKVKASAYVKSVFDDIRPHTRDFSHELGRQI